jgi:hypothetical protein
MFRIAVSLLDLSAGCVRARTFFGSLVEHVSDLSISAGSWPGCVRARPCFGSLVEHVWDLSISAGSWPGCVRARTLSGSDLGRVSGVYSILA